MTTRDEARRFFDSIAGRYDRVYAPPREETRARMARILTELAPRSRVLDLGVGTGRELSLLLDAGHDVTGLDVSPAMLERCARRSRPVPAVLADLWEPLPFEAQCFDAVLALHGTLAHPPRAEALATLAAEVGRVLVPGGVFALEVPLPGWIEAASAKRGERRPSRIGNARAVVTDDATAASIEAWLFERGVWEEALSGSLRVTDARETANELFLVARR
jgi:SAM-dependent methyltransferase